MAQPTRIEITHHDWRTDKSAVAEPWGVRIDGRQVSQDGVRTGFVTLNSAGDYARTCAADETACGGTAEISWTPARPDRPTTSSEESGMDAEARECERCGNPCRDRDECDLYLDGVEPAYFWNPNA